LSAGFTLGLSLGFSWAVAGRPGRLPTSRHTVNARSKKAALIIGLRGWF
jgi:hypothetical protein